ncbi:Protein CBG21142 [Caenorhabditis briggsae]|uniref:Protein CBG21142 n=1 Tax=Caenorhabditis briggsae TaxID=6238 RepID=A8XZE1_CAEBR|nr:Protein CBG21142 [Caenorhabditis briggsae]CAP38068.2 Protein CBG21142 [Caenorhabditis briggsae]
MVLFSKVRSGTDSETCTKSDEKRKRAGFEFAADPKEIILFLPAIYYMISFFIYNVVIIIVYGVRISNVRDSLAEIVGDGAPVVAEVNRWLTPFFGITITMLLLTLLVALLIFRMTFYCYKNR